MTTKLTLTSLQKELRSLRDPKKADFLAKYFKTGKGEYAEGDIFLGGIVTDIARKISQKYKIYKQLGSGWRECLVDYGKLYLTGKS